MCVRQPAVQGEEARLRAEADKEGRDDHGRDGWRQLADMGGDLGHVEGAEPGVQQQDAEVHHVGRGGADQEVLLPRLQRLVRLLVDHQQVGGPGHQLPEQVEVAQVIGGGDADQRADHQEQEEEVAVARVRMGHIAQGVDGDRKADAGEDQRQVAAYVARAHRRGDERERRQREYDSGRVAQCLGMTADQEQGEAAQIRQQDRQAPFRLEGRQPVGGSETGEMLDHLQEWIGEQADDDGGERQSQHGELGPGVRPEGNRRVGVCALPRLRKTHRLDAANEVDGGNDAGQRAAKGEKPLAVFQGGIENDELRQRAP